MLWLLPRLLPSPPPPRFIFPCPRRCLTLPRPALASDVERWRRRDEQRDVREERHSRTDAGHAPIRTGYLLLPPMIMASSFSPSATDAVIGQGRQPHDAHGCHATPRRHRNPEPVRGNGEGGVNDRPCGPAIIVGGGVRCGCHRSSHVRSHQQCSMCAGRLGVRSDTARSLGPPSERDTCINVRQCSDERKLIR